MPFPMVLTASSNVFLLRPEIATLAPSSCRRFAVASPIPLFPPVTTATFPCNGFPSFEDTERSGADHMSPRRAIRLQPGDPRNHFGVYAGTRKNRAWQAKYAPAMKAF